MLMKMSNWRISYMNLFIYIYFLKAHIYLSSFIFNTWLASFENIAPSDLKLWVRYSSMSWYDKDLKLGHHQYRMYFVGMLRLLINLSALYMAALGFTWWINKSFNEKLNQIKINKIVQKINYILIIADVEKKINLISN